MGTSGVQPPHRNVWGSKRKLSSYRQCRASAYLNYLVFLLTRQGLFLKNRTLSDRLLLNRYFSAIPFCSSFVGQRWILRRFEGPLILSSFPTYLASVAPYLEKLHAEVIQHTSRCCCPTISNFIINERHVDCHCMEL